jgi:competence protein CoiA
VSVILTAFTDARKLFTITSRTTKEELHNLRKSMTFFCPQCENPVRLKIGQVMIPHFAHIVLSNCLTSFSERESPTHLIGKIQLADFFHGKGLEVFVESYLPKIEQRPDLLVLYERKKFAIEFQCSVIPTNDIERRSAGYRKIGITPIWLLRTFDLPPIPQHGITSLQLSGFRQKFIEHHPVLGSHLMTYDPTNKQFTYFSHLMHINGTRFIAKIRSLPIDVQSYPFMMMKPLSEDDNTIYWHILQHRRSRFLRNRIFTSRKGMNDRLLRICYEYQVQLVDLPLFIGFPIEGSSCFSSSLIEWQVEFFYQCLQSQFSLDEINENWIEIFVKNHGGILNLEKGKEVVTEYIKILQKLEIQIDATIFYQNISEAKLLGIYHHLTVAKSYEY